MGEGSPRGRHVQARGKGHTAIARDKDGGTDVGLASADAFG